MWRCPQATSITPTCSTSGSGWPAAPPPPGSAKSSHRYKTIQQTMGHPDSMSSTTASNQTTPSTLPPLTRTVWPCVNYRDAHAALAFLADAFGFVQTLVVDGGPERPVA